MTYDVVPLLKHNPSAQEPEVLEAITVQREALIADLVDAALSTSGGLRHHLLVGPRGSGKSHVSALVAHRVRLAAKDGVVLAPLVEDPWSIRNYSKLIASLVAAVAESLGDDDLIQEAARLRAEGALDGADGEAILREAVGDRRLVVIVENLGDVFDRIGLDGQKRLRALAENWRQMLVLGTTPQLFEGVRDHDSPFYGFFRAVHLDELTLASAAELLRKVAEFRKDKALLEFLGGDSAPARLRAVEALAGGHPRVWLLLAGCVSVVAIDALVPLFMEALDDLTPYYQDRLRELGFQQQEIVMLLSEAQGALTNSRLAELSGLPANVVASRVAELAEKGYIRKAVVPSQLAAGDRRMTYWELREPLMRLCLDVKASRGKPLRIVVEFLREWYGVRLLDEIAQLPSNAALANLYAAEAFRSLDVQEIGVGDLLVGTPEEVLRRVETGLRIAPDNLMLSVARGLALIEQGEVGTGRKALDEAFAEFDEFAELDATAAKLEILMAHPPSWDHAEVARLVGRLTTLLDEPGQDADVRAWSTLARVRRRLGDADAAEAAWKRAAEIAPDDLEVLLDLSERHADLDDLDEAIEVAGRAAEKHPGSSKALGRYGHYLRRARRHEEAVEMLTRAIELAPTTARFHADAGIAYMEMDDLVQAEPHVRRAYELRPTTRSYQATLVMFLYRSEQFDELITIATEAEKHHPDVSAWSGFMAAAFANLGRHRDAIEAWRRSMALDPHDLDLPVNLAMSLMAAGEHDEALEVLSKLLAKQAGHAGAWRALAQLHYALGDSDQAMDAAEQAVLLEGDVEEVLAMATAFVRSGMNERALNALDRVRDQHRAAAVCGLLLAEIGRTDDARRVLEEALERSPEEPVLHRTMAQFLIDTGELVEADVHVGRATAAAPEDPVNWFVAAVVALAAGRSGDAVERLGKAAATWSDEQGLEFGNPELLCRILWRDVADRSAVLPTVVRIYDEVGALASLGSGLVAGVPAIIEGGTSQAAAEGWVEAWRAAADRHKALEVPLAMLEATVRWKADRDRAHLLALPSEQREILMELLLGDEPDED